MRAGGRAGGSRIGEVVDFPRIVFLLVEEGRKVEWLAPP